MSSCIEGILYECYKRCLSFKIYQQVVLLLIDTRDGLLQIFYYNLQVSLRKQGKVDWRLRFNKNGLQNNFM